jgi:hypothetical protein
MPAVIIGLCVPHVACQVLLVFVQDVAFKQSVVVCAALLFISLGLHGLAHRAGQNQVRRQEHTGRVVGSNCWVHYLCYSGGGIDDGWGCCAACVLTRGLTPSNMFQHDSQGGDKDRFATASLFWSRGALLAGEACPGAIKGRLCCTMCNATAAWATAVHRGRGLTNATGVL